MLTFSPYQIQKGHRHDTWITNHSGFHILWHLKDHHYHGYFYHHLSLTLAKHDPTWPEFSVTKSPDIIIPCLKNTLLTENLEKTLGPQGQKTKQSLTFGLTRLNRRKDHAVTFEAEHNPHTGHIGRLISCHPQYRNDPGETKRIPVTPQFGHNLHTICVSCEEDKRPIIRPLLYPNIGATLLSFDDTSLSPHDFINLNKDLKNMHWPLPIN